MARKSEKDSKAKAGRAVNWACLFAGLLVWLAAIVANQGIECFFDMPSAPMPWSLSHPRGLYEKIPGRIDHLGQPPLSNVVDLYHHIDLGLRFFLSSTLTTDIDTVNTLTFTVYHVRPLDPLFSLEWPPPFNPRDILLLMACEVWVKPLPSTPLFSFRFKGCGRTLQRFPPWIHLIAVKVLCWTRSLLKPEAAPFAEEKGSCCPSIPPTHPLSPQTAPLGNRTVQASHPQLASLLLTELQLVPPLQLLPPLQIVPPL